MWQLQKLFPTKRKKRVKGKKRGKKRGKNRARVGHFKLCFGVMKMVEITYNVLVMFIVMIVAVKEIGVSGCST